MSEMKFGFKKNLQMLCKIRFGEQEPLSSEVFVKDDDGIDGDFAAQVWQGRLNESYFRFDMAIDDEPPQPRSLEIKVCEVDESQEASLGLVYLDLSPMMFKDGT